MTIQNSLTALVPCNMPPSYFLHWLKLDVPHWMGIKEIGSTLPAPTKHTCDELINYSPPCDITHTVVLSKVIAGNNESMVLFKQDKTNHLFHGPFSWEKKYRKIKKIKFCTEHQRSQQIKVSKKIISFVWVQMVSCWTLELSIWCHVGSLNCHFISKLSSLCSSVLKRMAFSPGHTKLWRQNTGA